MKMILNLKNNILIVFVIIFVLSFSTCDSGNKGNDKSVKPVRSAQPVKTRINKQVEDAKNTSIEKNDNISDIEKNMLIISISKWIFQQ